MTEAQLLADQSIVYSDFPTEPVTIGVVVYQCQVLQFSNDAYLTDGGFVDQPGIKIAIDRTALADAPEVGLQVTFRSTLRRIEDVDDDDLQAPIVITLKGVADER